MSTETCFFILSILHKLIVCLKSIKIWLVYHFSEHYLCSPMYTYCFILLLIWSCQFYSSHKNSRHRGNSLSPTVIILSVARATSLGIIFYSFHPDLPHAILFIFQLNTPALAFFLSTLKVLIQAHIFLILSNFLGNLWLLSHPLPLAIKVIHYIPCQVY